MKKRLLVMLLSFSLGISSISGVVVNAAKTKTDKKTESTKKDTSKKDNSKKDTSKKDNSKKDDSKKDTNKKESKSDSSSDDTKNSVGVANDGKPKSKASDCYGDSGYTASFKNVKYYDVLLPYKSTCKKIGGYATAGRETMSSSTQNTNIGSLVAREQSVDYFQRKCPTLYSKIIGESESWKYDKGGVCVVKDKNGIEYYVMAIQEFFYNCSATKRFKDFEGSTGQLVDVFLTDGTCIHFVVGDANSSYHTNGGQKPAKGSSQQYNWFTAFAPLNYEHYRNLYAASNGNCPEIWASANESVSYFRKKYKLSDKVRIAYYRMYNKTLGSTLETVSEDRKNVSFDAGKQVVGETNTENVKNNATVVSTALTYQEADLSAFTKLEEVDIADKYLSGANKGTLGQSDISSLKSWEDNINDSTILSGVIKFLRVLTQIIGILFLMWILLIYVGYWFDRLNNFVDLDAVGILTLNKLHTSDTDEECTFSLKSVMKEKKMTVNHKAILGICLTGGVFGVLVVSGQVYVILGYFVNGMLALFGQG